ncbi:hypothetical protein MVEN_01625000 [Mycena venus]|uniref:U1-type domain-containing protein n=1 Tax=Mycena venus TaxID=2733690 RepID=A0A8H6XNP3_9AGAR|nr:hypothetical protein MVEN_01625000 [Mycena venus]
MPRATAFSTKTGKFPSSRPDVWDYNAEEQTYCCTVCPNFTPVPLKRVTEHETGTRHKRNVKVFDRTNRNSALPAERDPPPQPTASRIRGPLAQTLAQISQQPQPKFPDDSWVDTNTGTINIDWNSDLMDIDTRQQEPLTVRNTALLTEQLHAYLNSSINSDSESDEENEDNDSGRAKSDSDSEGEEVVKPIQRKRRRVINLEEPGSEWFPWPDKETFVLDILRHVPRCSFSKKQNAAIHWAMLALGLNDLPSDRVMDDIDKVLQPLCGIQTIRYAGKLGHVYYVNDLAAIIAQEMANPSVRKNLHFLPEDTTPSLSEAWQASRWLDELDSDLTTPMIRKHGQDFFIHEPTMLRDGNKTASGIKDTYQAVFLDRIFALSTKKGRTKPQKQADVRALRRTFPTDIASPVWRIKDIDPHQDTPVEILHVILLGFVKYFWRDAIARVQKSDKEVSIARLYSFNGSGLGISALAGHTRVNYSGSLTGRDFRAIVQAAPFVLQGLLPEKNIRAWTALIFCGIGDGVVYDDPATSSRRIGSVVEIVQILGSAAEQSGIADFLLVTPAIVGEAHDLYSMRRLQSINEYKCLNIEDIQCTVNIQHNCADNNCTITFQYFVPNDRIVNTAQMRDAEALAPFRFKPASLPQTSIIQSAAELEFSVRQTKANAKDASSVPVPPAASEFPPFSSSSQPPLTAPLLNVPQVRPVFQNPPSSFRWSSGGDTQMYDST